MMSENTIADEAHRLAEWAARCICTKDSGAGRESVIRAMGLLSRAEGELRAWEKATAAAKNAREVREACDRALFRGWKEKCKKA